MSGALLYSVAAGLRASRPDVINTGDFIDGVRAGASVLQWENDVSAIAAKLKTHAGFDVAVFYRDCGCWKSGEGQ
jgi:hypothetical protein